MKCLVTGAGGYIGESLVKRLARDNHKVIGLIYKSTPKGIDSNVKYVHGDITDRNKLSNIIKDIDVIFHCAALIKDYGPREDFYKINYKGTKNLVLACESIKIKKFIFLSHIGYDSLVGNNYYAETKILSEKYLLNQYKINRFPIVIIRPGNVYGPGAAIWVLKPIKSIKKNRIALINQGNGIFLHTYIDNLIDALIATMKTPGIIGESFDITDGDNSITWGRYLNDLSMIITGSQIKKNFSTKSALIIGKLMLILNRIFKVEPWITPTAVNIFSNKKEISIEKAKKLLNYEPKVDYIEVIEQIKKWLKSENYL